MAKDFPSDFYVTCATVIPVLFLALVVQGGTYEAVLRTGRIAAQRLPRRNREYVVAKIVPWVAFVALCAGFAGELLALGALYTRSELGAERTFVVSATAILLLAVVAAPASRLGRAYLAIDRQQLSPVLRVKGRPEFGYGADRRPLWSARDMEAERIRGALRDAGCPEFGEPAGGFVVEGGHGVEPFYVACTMGDAMRAAAQMTIYEDVLASAGFQAEPDPDVDQALQVRIPRSLPDRFPDDRR